MMKIKDVAKQVRRFCFNESIREDEIVSAHLLLICNDGVRQLQITQGVMGHLFGEINHEIIKACLRDHLNALCMVGQIAGTSSAHAIPNDIPIKSVEDLIKSVIEGHVMPREEKH